MKKHLFLLLFLSATQLGAKAQLMPFGTIDTTDLRMTSCSFEKEANAEVLFDYARVFYKDDNIFMERHKRIKIFNDNGKDEANIRIEFYGAHHDEEVTDVVAETINIKNKTFEYTPVDQKLIYTEAVDKSRRAIVFTFPDVQPGSVVEFKYKWKTIYVNNYPDWIFQSSVPTRFSEFDAGFNGSYLFNYFRKVYQPISKDTIIRVDHSLDSEHIWALSDIKSYKPEPYMDYPEDYLECVIIKKFSYIRTWPNLGNDMLQDEDFGLQLQKNLSNEKEITATVNKLKNTDEKIAYIFDTVKKSMKWNKMDYWFTVDGIKKAWDKKTGNSAEINLILYHLLKSANIHSSLMVVCTRDNGKINPGYATYANLNRTVVYYPIDSANYYILDASNSYNTYNNIPFDLMGLDAFAIDPVKEKSELRAIKPGPAREVILIAGEISDEGKLKGTTQISSSAATREKYLRRYNELGEEKYVDQLQEKDKNLKILSLKMQNANVDTLPLIQTFEYDYKLAEPDGDYMYFNPNVFNSLETNPFMGETRISNIDLRCLYNYSINVRFKIPAGYKVEALPKQATMQMPDKGIVFKRLAAEQDGMVLLRFLIDYKKNLFESKEYPSIHDFFKKMYEMLNEQIVLKKQ